MKIFIPVMLFGVYVMIFICIVTFRRLFLVEKGVMCMFGVCRYAFRKRLKSKSEYAKKCAFVLLDLIK